MYIILLYLTYTYCIIAIGLLYINYYYVGIIIYSYYYSGRITAKAMINGIVPNHFRFLVPISAFVLYRYWYVY